MDNQAFNDYLTNVRANAASDVQAPQQMPQQQAPAPQQQAPAPQQQGNGGNWLTHLLPTAGSLGGGMGGAALGASLGSIVPGVGTAIGGIAGGILGAAFGGGGGKAAENATEGKDIGHDVGTAAIEGGVGQAAGGVVGKVLGKGAELLTNRASGITKAATDTAEHAAVDKAAIDAATNMKNAYADVPKGLQKAYDAEGQANLVKNLGMDPTNAEHLKGISTSANDVLNSNLNNVLAGSGTRDLSDYNQIVKDAVGNNGFNLGSSDPTALSKGRLGPANTPAAKLVQQLEQHGMGVANSSADPVEVRNLISRLQSVAADAKPGVSAVTGAKDADQVASYKSINDVVNQLKDRLYNTDEVKQGITGLQGNLQAADVGGNQALADHLNGILSDATEGQHILTPMSTFTKMNQLGNSLDDAQKIVGSPAAFARAKGDLNGDGIPDNTQTSNAPQMAGDIASAHGTVGKALALGKYAVNNPGILNTLSRMGSLLSKAAPAAGVVAGTAPNMAADPVAAQSQQDGTMGAAMQPAQQNPLSALYETLLQNYQAGGGITPNDASTAGTLATLAPAVQKQNLASTELSAIPGAFANAGGAQGTGGILSHIAGLIPGTAAHTFQQQQAGAAQALAAQLGISPEAAMGLLPQLMQNQQIAGQNTGVLGQLQGQLAY